jgi:molecular chaperone IbpA
VLYLGIAARAFERSIQLADHVAVEGASLDNGLLHVELVREIPEAMKPRTIPITGPSNLLEATPAQIVG